MKRIVRYLACLVTVATTGCISLGEPTPPSRFYLLAAPAAPEVAAPAVGELQLATVALPAYLDRPQLVTRRSEQELEIAPYDRWGEPLATGITRVLAATLRQRLPQLVVAGEGSAAVAAGWRLQVSFDRFEGNQVSGQVEMAARWRLTNNVGQILNRGSVELAAPWPTRGSAALVDAYDQLLARFGATLAAQLAAAVTPGRDG